MHDSTAVGRLRKLEKEVEEREEDRVEWREESGGEEGRVGWREESGEGKGE